MGTQDGEQVLDGIRAIVFSVFHYKRGLRAMALLEQP